MASPFERRDAYRRLRGGRGYFRDGLYACFETAPAALMNAADALLTESPARSFPKLSLSPCFSRRWPSLYAAFQDGWADRRALRQLFAAAAPIPLPGERPILMRVIAPFGAPQRVSNRLAPRLGL